MKKFISIMLAIFLIPVFFVGCSSSGNDNGGSNNGSNNNGGSNSGANTAYTECVNTLKSAINNIANNNDDILNGYGIYNTYTSDINGTVSTYFESEKPVHATDYYGSYYFTYEDQMIKHYSLFSTKYNYDNMNTYAKLDDGSYIQHNNAENTMNLCERATLYFFMAGGRPQFTEDAVISWYEKNDDCFVIICKYSTPGDNYMIAEYTVENSKLVSIDSEIYNYNTHKLRVTQTCDIKYGITVDAYVEYQNAKNSLN